MSETIDELVRELSEADTNDKELFHNLIASACEVLDLNDLSIAREFSASRSTVLRWKNGAAAPHPTIRKHVYDYLKAQLNLKQYET